MQRPSAKPVRGIHAPRPRPTLPGALWLACLLSVPVFVVLSAVELAWRFLSG